MRLLRVLLRQWESNFQFILVRTEHVEINKLKYFFQIGTIFPGRYINITETIHTEEPPGNHLEHRKYIITTILVISLDMLNYFF